MNETDNHRSAVTRHAEDICFDALAFESADERNAFVEIRCEGDADLRKEVDRLMDVMADMNAFFENETPLQITAEDLVDTVSKLLDPLE